MTELSYPGEQVRRYDHDRFMTAIFAADAVRADLFALYAFNIEIAKTTEAVTEPLIGQMRLQWWRDTLDRLYAGQPVAHGVAGPLGHAIERCALDRAEFDRLIDARETDLDRQAPPDDAALMAYAEASSAPLLMLALATVAAPGRLLPEAAQAARHMGIAWALTGLLRAVPFHARQRRLYLPVDRLDAARVRQSRLFALDPEPGLPRVVESVANLAGSHLHAARRLIPRVPRRQRSPLLLGGLGAIYLGALRRAGWNPFVLEKRPPPAMIFARLAIRAVTGLY